ncbi:Lipoyl synthase [Candidatus Clavichlamydia salmonicola]|uniref:lipoyl synthase n=1 Tax=Candidatus Clavichlamydia salmonicola TaxID=469812 RepID=UPI0018912AF6|nr:lipoyl synthase [Candidatus Clavichlamydia salmonicola]MBF5050559.1 Lipoyl synthase [Candidatus Clavichlamydia salmonicola]
MSSVDKTSPSSNKPSEESTTSKASLFPKWLRRKLPTGRSLGQTTGEVREQKLFTVCEEAFCPNQTECWSRNTATFLALGKYCSRKCGFCNISFAKNPPPLEEDEPERIAEAVIRLKLKHVVITMVARDDLADGGAEQLVKIMATIRKKMPSTSIEIFPSDLAGNVEALDLILSANPNIFNHNLETVRRLTPFVRHKATYDRSLSMLKHVHLTRPDILIKSGIMVGLGESPEEVQEVLHDLLHIGCQVVTIGQYLQPNRLKVKVRQFIDPERFDTYAEYGKTLGLLVYAGPFIRSSYNADKIFELIQATVV